VPKGQHTVKAAGIRQALIQTDRASASQMWRHVADQVRPRFEKLAWRISAYPPRARRRPTYRGFGFCAADQPEKIRGNLRSSVF
jgi:hypothetical protein